MSPPSLLIGQSKALKTQHDRKNPVQIVRKQHVPGPVPSNIRKQYIDSNGGGMLGNVGLAGLETQPHYVDDAANGLSAQSNVANTLQGTGLSPNNDFPQDGANDIQPMLKGGNELDSMSNDLVDTSESTGGRQMIGNGKNSPTRRDISPA